MTRDGMRGTNNNYGDSPGRRGSVPIASSLLRADRAYRRSQLRKRLASSARGTATRLPFGSAVESWPPQPSACPRPSPHAVPRVDDASRDASDDDGGVPNIAASRASYQTKRDAQAKRKYVFSPRRSREGTLSAPRRTLRARSTGRGQLARPARHDESADSWVAGSASLPLHLKHADHAPG